MFIKFKTENLIAKLQNLNRNFTFSWVSLIGFSTTWPEGATLLGWPKSIYYFEANIKTKQTNRGGRRTLIIQKLSVQNTVQFKTLNSQIKVTKGKKRDRKFSTNTFSFNMRRETYLKAKNGSKFRRPASLHDGNKFILHSIKAKA